MKYAFVFPGQGSQFVGMGKNLAENFASAREVFEEVDDALNQHLFKLMTEGPETELMLTANTQPALMANSMAVIKVLEKEFAIDLSQKVAFVAGHSLGEYSAACAAGVFSVSQAAKLLRLRGEAMQKAVPFGIGGMVAVIGLKFEDALALAEDASTKDAYCVPANDNSEGQVVLSGHKKALERVFEIAPEFGAKKVVELAVSAPFHSPLMLPAEKVMQEALAQIKAHEPKIKLVSNVTAEVAKTAEEVVRNLVAQVTKTVRWRETMSFLHLNAVTDVAEIGAGRVLTGLMKRSYKDINTFSVNSLAEIEELADNL